jgi:hypothetical protein
MCFLSVRYVAFLYAHISWTGSSVYRSHSFSKTNRIVQRFVSIVSKIYQKYPYIPGTSQKYRPDTSNMSNTMTTVNVDYLRALKRLAEWAQIRDNGVDEYEAKTIISAGVTLLTTKPPHDWTIPRINQALDDMHTKSSVSKQVRDHIFYWAHLCGTNGLDKSAQTFFRGIAEEEMLGLVRIMCELHLFDRAAQCLASLTFPHVTQITLNSHKIQGEADVLNLCENDRKSASRKRKK